MKSMGGQRVDRWTDGDEYRRPITWAEAEEMRLGGLLPAGYEARGRILVRQLTPGVRTRSSDGVVAFPKDVRKRAS